MTEPLPPHGGQPTLAAGVPLAEARTAVIMIHGRGAGPKNILDLAPAFPQQHVAYVAPAASGGTWYPSSFMSPIEHNEPGISSGISVIHALIEQVTDAGVPEDHIVLLGFSQGACLTATAAHRRPRRYGGVVVFSGGLIGPPGTRWSEDGDFAGTPVYFGCSDRDAHVPEARVHESAGVLTRMNALATVRIFQGMGHLVNDEEIAWARGLIDNLVA